jgi:hypothetical protein
MSTTIIKIKLYRYLYDKAIPLFRIFKKHPNRKNGKQFETTSTLHLLADASTAVSRTTTRSTSK